MNEEEWLISNTAPTLLAHVARRASARKLRLFACAASRRVLHLVTHEAIRSALEVSERHADGGADRKQLREAGNLAQRLALDIPQRPGTGWNAARTVAMTAALDAQAAATRAAESAADADLVREHFGDPFRPLVVPPAVLAWQDHTVVRLAQAAYDERFLPAGTLDNVRLTILTDALEEAGDVEEPLLLHLRSCERHYRGCFAIDALLGKS